MVTITSHIYKIFRFYFPNHVSESTTNYYLDLQHVTVSPKIFFKIVTGDKIHFKKTAVFPKSLMVEDIPHPGSHQNLDNNLIFLYFFGFFVRRKYGQNFHIFFIFKMYFSLSIWPILNPITFLDFTA